MCGFGLSFRVREGVNLGNVRQSLRHRAMEGHNIAAGVGGTEVGVTVNRYLQWVNTVETMLRLMCVDPTAWDRLRSETFWHIRDLTSFSPRWQELIYTEAELQSRLLDDLIAALDRLDRRVKAAEGRLVVFDTNVLLEHESPEQVKWGEIVKTTPVRSVIPLRVLDELDEKKYTARDDKADWARRLLSRLWKQLGTVGDNPVSLAEGVTVEVPIEDGPRRRTVDADQEVLDTCDDIRRLGQPVVLVTADYGMCIRAAAVGLTVERVPEKYLRRKIKVAEQQPADTSGEA